MSVLAHILRDPHERWKRCSLYPLRERTDLAIIDTRHAKLDDYRSYTLLTPDGAVLSAADAARPLLLVDASWRRAAPILKALAAANAPRALPPVLRSAYPRRSAIFTDPTTGLSTVEALYAALCLLGRPDASLLEGYRWREAFLTLNREALARTPELNRP